MLLDHPDEKFLEDAKLKTSQIIPMTHPKTKIQYHCVIPAVNETSSLETEESVSDTDVRTLLAPLGTSCMYRLAGWWSYEFCYGKHIRQYHQEKDLPVRPQDEFFLGKFKEVQDGVKINAQVEDEDHSKKYFKNYFSEKYTGGTTCDLTGDKRQTEVRYYCANDKTTSSIIDIKEPFSCNYIMMISTPLLCKHPSYKPKKEVVETIYCVPTTTATKSETKVNVLQETLQVLEDNTDDEDLDYSVNSETLDDEEIPVKETTTKKTMEQWKEEIEHVEGH
eukprot:CAMPEP_0168548054 /NCGR_PEP_ID=MMETSP0413-20121227/4360_1 /TAXON_ID=136452 /ORGANISM="Filamoeba nolandi, Strain NC-AS-23-1" /LENGTH=277 /DNA_ID=CAMNT_0008578339 /DNA_START=156 /DNA_END=989 /DNA_ORIENTATION=+